MLLFHQVVLACFAAVLMSVTSIVDANELLIFGGTLVNDLGQPIEGAQIQFWHTDPNGNYKHPDFVTSGPLLDTFQYFGTSEPTTADGKFDFTTYRPGIYSQRPIAHIHYKVWHKGQDRLTSQFYFRDEGHTQFPEPLQLDLVPYETMNGTVVANAMVSNKTIVLNFGLGGALSQTPSQTAGPYYPAVDFFDFDSDLTTVSTMEEGTKTPSAAPTEPPVASFTNGPSSLPPTSLPPVTPPPPTTTAPVTPTTTTSPISTTVASSSGDTATNSVSQSSEMDDGTASSSNSYAYLNIVSWLTAALAFGI